MSDDSSDHYQTNLSKLSQLVYNNLHEVSTALIVKSEHSIIQPNQPLRQTVDNLMIDPTCNLSRLCSFAKLSIKKFKAAADLAYPFSPRQNPKRLPLCPNVIALFPNSAPSSKLLKHSSSLSLIYT